MMDNEALATTRRAEEPVFRTRGKRGRVPGQDCCDEAGKWQGNEDGPNLSPGMFLTAKYTARQAATKELKQEQTEETEKENFCRKCAIFIDSTSEYAKPERFRGNRF
jgi:hypothetical protein